MKEGKEKERDFTCNSKADKISLVYHKKRWKQQNKRKTDEQLSPEMVISVRSVRKGEGDYGGKDLWRR